MMMGFLTNTVFGIFEVWQLLLLPVLIGLIIFWIQYRKRQT